MRNTIFLVLISLFFLTNPSFAGEKVEAPELPNFTEWNRGSVLLTLFPKEGEGVVIKAAFFYEKYGKGVIRLLYNREDKPRFVFYSTPGFKTYFYENRGLSEEDNWQFVVDTTGWDFLKELNFFNERYGTNFPLEDQK